MKKTAIKRVVFISDLHCGHRSGLTPPEWQWPEKASGPERRKYAKVQHLLWNWYAAQIKALQPVYAVVVNGDAVDGKGSKSGGTEQLTLDPDEQADMASTAIKCINPKKVYMTYGTPYHTGSDQDWENIVAKQVGAEKIADSLELDINGVLFHCRHSVSRSIIPHGRYTAPARELLWDKLWAADEERSPCDVLIRSHVHYFVFGGDTKQLFIITPALQAYSKYGVRQCSGEVHIGFVYFDIVSREEYSWDRRLFTLKKLKSPPLKA